MTEPTATPFAEYTEADLRRVFDRTGYVAEDDILIPVLLALRLGKPLLIEGEPGSGKTELGKVLADGLETDLVRLQCYEGLAAENTLYEWNYTKQLLSVQAGERGVTDDGSVFDEEYLLERPLLRALSGDRDRPAVLLIDEVDRADREFEALLLEFLSDFQVSVPELGTIEASVPPIVLLTSNRTRGLSDALKRRCLYLHVEPPSFEKEREIVQRKVPELDGATAAEICGVVQRLREEPLLKRPGIAETLDWSRALLELRSASEDGSSEPAASLSPQLIDRTLSCLLKEVEDASRIDDELLETLARAARDARERTEAQ
ncbi:MoxR family ATPase [Natrinema versiforme]|uniref:MoxR family ATPase n=1 Tax=Natrinema versiforme TaxID=88724 RepID=A0A4V1FYS3_9EURY|nr:MoxR family ATPase [Natrinema versiforme]QCS41424.1 MoxR family ATPase [Natrinema versiforme]